MLTEAAGLNIPIAVRVNQGQVRRSNNEVQGLRASFNQCQSAETNQLAA
eukprot:SAG31_NODE_4570_length_3128_cov_1.267745_1_plen_48_part_10